MAKFRLEADFRRRNLERPFQLADIRFRRKLDEKHHNILTLRDFRCKVNDIDGFLAEVFRDGCDEARCVWAGSRQNIKVLVFRFGGDGFVVLFKRDDADFEILQPLDRMEGFLDVFYIRSFGKCGQKEHGEITAHDGLAQVFKIAAYFLDGGRYVGNDADAVLEHD